MNLDGTAHHRKSKGFKVPKKHAEELKGLGVKFKEGNILESFEIPKNEHHTFFTFYIIIED